MYDETPDQINLEFKDRLETAEDSNAIYDNHLGKNSFDAKHEQMDLSQYRSRGYKVIVGSFIRCVYICLSR